MTCPLCRGAQNLASFHEKRGLEYWPCSCCGGAGVTIVWSRPTYNTPKEDRRAIAAATAAISKGAE